MNYLHKRFICLCLVSVFLLSACQQSPNLDVVTSKNDGSFDVNIVQAATSPTKDLKGDLKEEEISIVKYSGSFFSTDESVKYTLNINTSVTNKSMPVVEVEPYYFTEEDAERVAKVLFGESSEFFESRSRHSDVIYSKNEIQAKLMRWSQYANADSIRLLYGRSREDVVEIVQAFIEMYTKKYEVAPQEDQNISCDWHYRKDSYYSLSDEEIKNNGTADDNDAIKAELDVGNIHYAYNVAVRNKEDFKMSRISAYLYDGISPDNIDERIYRAILCRTEEPTQAQIDSIQEKATEILEDMNLGNWKIDSCYLDSIDYGTDIEYIVNITAVPVFKEIAVIRQPQLRNLKSENVYASNYYLTDAAFEFAPNGELINFTFTSPLRIKKIISDNTATLSLDDLLEKAKAYLSLYDRSAYALSEEMLTDMEEIIGEKLICIVDVCNLEYGLSRVKVPNTDESYYYVPSVVLYGKVDYCGKESGTQYGVNGLAGDNGVMTLVTLNAIDGSIINVTN